MTRRARIEGHRDPMVRLALMRPKSSGGTVTNVTGTAPIVVTGGATKNVALEAPAYDFVTNPAPVAILTTPTLLVGPTITPEVTGKITVRITGVVENADSTTPHLFEVTIQTTAGSAIASDTIRVDNQVAGVNGVATFALVAALDMAPLTPFTGVPGTPTTIDVLGIASVNGQLTVQTRGVQVEFQERLT